MFRASLVRMVSVGLTGGIGSGKSTVARLLRERGAVVIDADELAREVVAPGTPGLVRVFETFGPAVQRADGSLDRAALAAVVFADADRLEQLNAIVHPLVGERARELRDAAPTGAVVVHDVPLLVENGLASQYDVVVVVDVPESVQVQRLVSGDRGMSETDARARIAAQATRSQRLAVADHVIDNSGDPAHLERQVAVVWRDVQRRRGGGATAAPTASES
jgi:dephospho-CoA kinase